MIVQSVNISRSNTQTPIQSPHSGVLCFLRGMGVDLYQIDIQLI